MNYVMGVRALRTVAAAAALCCAGAAMAAVPPGAAAEILSLQGAGEQRAGSATQWQPARLAQPLAAGDYVRTRESARMALLFADQTQVRLHQNTVLQVRGVAAAGGQSATTLMLQAGRAWAQTRRPPGSPLNLQTPAANAGIRGTDWDIEVGPDGKTMLTVLSGEVTLSNAHGEVVVARNEAAIAEVGKAPVKIRLTQPRDRIQWVNALKPEPRRYLPAGSEPQDLQAAARQIEQGDTAAAEKRLRALLTASAPVPAYLMLADLQTVDGDHVAATETLQAGLKRWPGNPELRAELARAQLLADRVADSARTLGEARDADAPSLWIARGALARREGDAGATVAAYSRATELAPKDDRAWFGLGSAHTEREDARPASAALLRALELNAQGAGYRGELGTLETFRNDFAAADRAFAQALADNPADYVALTGLGLLRLKQGQPEAALDAFLRAGVMEPRYARAKSYTGVAYYQLGRHQDAIATFQHAAALDDKDPLPHMFLSQIYTDLFRAGDAVQASRDAVQRMPYLKSLNQVANDQQGRANFGASLAFFGMEDWALELAQQGYHPYWGGSHLFLADRYPGEFNKNSELFQGYLSDPLAFGGSNRFSTLLQRPGHYADAGLLLEDGNFRMSSPSATLNGLVHGAFPIAYFVKAQKVIGTRFPLETGMPGSTDADVRLGVGTVGLGLQPSANLGVFGYLNQSDIRIAGRERFSVFEAWEPTNTVMDSTTRQAVAGMSYRWSPTSQTWLKLGYGEDFMAVQAYPTPFEIAPFAGTVGMYAEPMKRVSDFQLRHTADLGAATRVSVGFEHVKERQFNDAAVVGPLYASLEGQQFQETLVFRGTNDIDRRFSALTLEAQHKAAASLRLDGSLTANQIRHRVLGHNQIRLVTTEINSEDEVRRNETERVLAPRLGVVYQANANLTVRAAYQDWLRPLSVGTLNSVDTAGIPVEDRFVEAGGRHKRSVVQLGWTLSSDTFLSAKLDHLRVNNPGSEGVDLRTPSLPFLEELRNAQLVNLSTSELLEDTPSFERGTLRAAALGVNHMFGRRLSGYAKYLYQSSDSDYADAQAAGGRARDRLIPYVPRHTAAIGATWASARRLYLSGRVVYRSKRFEDQENLTARRPGWNLDLVGYWESQDKHWVIGAGALNLLGRKSEGHKRRLVVDARYRF